MHLNAIETTGKAIVPDGWLRAAKTRCVPPAAAPTARGSSIFTLVQTFRWTSDPEPFGGEANRFGL